MERTEYDPKSHNAMFARIETRLDNMAIQLEQALAWQASFGIRTEKRLNEVDRKTEVTTAKAVGALFILSAISGFLAWLGVMIATVWWKR
jgi:hypothetical protein